jgi:hypothetical protein
LQETLFFYIKMDEEQPDLNVFMEKLRELKSSLSLPSVHYSSTNASVDDDDINQPHSFSISFDTIESIYSKIETRSVNEPNMYKFVEAVTNLMPGFPGGGRSFIEIPINITMMEIGKTMKRVRDVLEKFKECFKYGQNLKHHKHLMVKVDDDNNSYIDKIDFLACLPENGGSPSIDIGIKYITNSIVLVISVDSYWQPAIDLFKKTYEYAFNYSFNMESKGEIVAKTNSAIDDAKKECYHDASKTLTGTAKDKFCYADGNGPSSSSAKPTETLVFKTAGITYVEYMSFIHRNAVLTSLLKMVSKIKNSKKERIIDKKYQHMILSNSFQLPSIHSSMFVLFKEECIYSNEKPIHVQLIDSSFIKNAVHSTIRFIHDGDDGSITVNFSKREFIKSDVFMGNAIVFYGDNDGGYIINGIKANIDFINESDINDIKFTAKNKENNNYLSDLNIAYFNPFQSNVYISRSLNEIIYPDDIIWPSVYKSRWMNYQGKMQFQRSLYGISFSEEEEQSLERNFKDIIPFQPYCTDIGINVFHKSIENQFLVEMAIHEFIKHYNEGIDVKLYEKSQIILFPVVLSLQCVRSIDKMDINELISMQIKKNELIDGSPKRIIVPGYVSNLMLEKFSEDNTHLGNITFKLNSEPKIYFPDQQDTRLQTKRYYTADYTIQ